MPDWLRPEAQMWHAGTSNGIRSGVGWYVNSWGGLKGPYETEDEAREVAHQTHPIHNLPYGTRLKRKRQIDMPQQTTKNDGLEERARGLSARPLIQDGRYKGHWRVSSGSLEDVGYTIKTHGLDDWMRWFCSCEAGLHGTKGCSHVRAVRQRMDAAKEAAKGVPVRELV